MSASNWAKCPNCAKKFHDAHDARLEAAYGVLPKEEFALLVNEAEEVLGETFREDYKIHGASEGVVRVHYSGSCNECGLILTFNHEHALDLDD